MKRRLKIISAILSICLIFSFSSSCINIFIPLKMWDGERLEFTLTPRVVTETELLLDEAKEATLSGSLNQNSIWNEFMLNYYDVATQTTMAMIMQYSDVTNEGYKANYMFALESYNKIYSKYLKVLKEIYNSSVGKDFFNGWTQEQISTFLYFNDEVAALDLENEQLLVEYSELSDGEFYDGSIDIYKKTIENNNKIAKNYKYDNYYEYATEAVYGRDYSTLDRIEFRNLVKEYIVPFSAEVFSLQKSVSSNLSSAKAQILRQILFDDYDAAGSVNYFDGYVNGYSGNTKEGFKHAFENKNYLMTDSVNSTDVAFTTYLYSYNEPFCYFGSGVQDVFTIVHETGHYYSGLFTGGVQFTMDLSEVHSQANEMLFLEYLEGVLDSEVYEALELYILANTVSTVMVATMVDEIEEVIYKTDVSTWTSDDFDDVIADVVATYGGEIYLNANVFGNSGCENYFRRVAVRQPVYYLSYATSAVTALAFYSEIRDGRQLARNKYANLAEKSKESQGFVDNLTSAGFSSPFNVATFYKVKGILDDKTSEALAA